MPSFPQPNPKLKYLFIHYTSDVLGGIETLIGRMAGYLVAEGHEVSILTTSAKHWEQLLPASVRCVQLGGKFRGLFYPSHAARIWQSTRLPVPDVIKSFDLPTSWCASIISAHAGGQARLISGIYNPYVFDHKNGKQVRMHGWNLFLKNYLENIPNKSKVVCDPEIQNELLKVHGSHHHARLWPLPVDGKRFSPIRRKPSRGKIVSVGRLAPMKEYNLYMVSVIRGLRERGHDVTWTIYGSGTYEKKVRALISEQGLTDFIHLKGEIAYDQLGEVLQDAYLFVGMGTSIIEASFCRVPNVLALAYDESGLTYGPLYQVPFGRVGQILEGNPPTKKAIDEIERILQLNESEYRAEEERVYRYVEPYDLDTRMREFQEIVGETEPPRSAHKLYYSNYLYAGARAVGVHLDNFWRV